MTRLPTPQTALDNFVIDRIDMGSVTIVPMVTIDVATSVPDDPVAGQGFWRYVEAHSDTGSRYVVLVSELSPYAAGEIGGKYLVSMLYPWSAVWVLNNGYLTCSYVMEHFGTKVGKEVSVRDMICITRTIALACDAKDDTAEMAARFTTMGEQDGDG